MRGRLLEVNEDILINTSLLLKKVNYISLQKILLTELLNAGEVKHPFTVLQDRYLLLLLYWQKMGLLFLSVLALATTIAVTGCGVTLTPLGLCHCVGKLVEDCSCRPIDMLASYRGPGYG